MIIDIASVNPYFHSQLLPRVLIEHTNERGKREVSDGSQKEEGFEEAGNEKEGHQAQGGWTPRHEEEGREAEGYEAQGRRKTQGRSP
jgi:hypothetical protein